MPHSRSSRLSTRLAARLGLPVLVVPALLALPVGTAPLGGGGSEAELHTVALPTAAVTGSALRAVSTTIALPPRETEEFSVVGVTWRPTQAEPDLEVEVRARRTDGRWTSWKDLHGLSRDTPDAGSPDTLDGLRHGTVPAFVGPSDAVEVRVEVGSGPVPQDLRVDLVDPGEPPAAPSGTAHAAAEVPPIVTRAGWGADESMRRCTPSYTGTPRVGFVHHTASTNDYSREQAPAAVRGFYAYHVKSNGWCDLGYNFLVDKYGTVYEGRYGGIDRAVLGAHTGGLNSNSFGVAMIGTFTSVMPSEALRSSLARLMGWKLGLSYVDPTGTAQLTAGRGSRFPSGSTQTFKVVSGHRDGVSTSCPGDVGYSILDQLRQDVRAAMGNGLVTPSATPTTVPADGGPVTVSAGLLAPADWRLEVLDDATGTVLDTVTGTRTDVVDATTNLTGAAPGRYRLSLSGSSASGELRPWTSTVTVRAPAGGSASPTPTASPSTAPTTSPTTSPTSTPTSTPRSTEPPSAAPSPAVPAGSRFVPLPPARVLDTRTTTGPRRSALTAGETYGLVLAGNGGVPADATAVALNLTATGPTSGTHLTVYPRGAARPETAVLNLRAGQTAASLVVAGLGTGGAANVYNLAGQVHLVVDVVGYWTSGAGSAYTPLAPARLLDTRTAAGGARRLADQETTTLQVRGQGGVPASATGVVLNVTAVGAAAPGYLTVSPSGRRTETSSVNFTAGQTVPNRVVTGLSSSGEIDVFAAGGAHVLVDVVGWFGPSGGLLRPVTPSRLVDSRTGTGTERARLDARETREVQVTGTAGVPRGATAVVLSLTAVAPSATQGFVTAWAADAMRPGTSDLNTVAGEVRSNLAVVPLSADGRMALYNESGTVHLVADVLGYVAP